MTEIVEIPNRGHALTIDSGWREVADTALAFVKRFVRKLEPISRRALEEDKRRCSRTIRRWAT